MPVSRVRVRVSWAQVNVPPNPPAQPSRPGTLSSPAKVLLVLDQPVVADVVRLTLRHVEYEVAHAISAREAVRLVARQPTHLVLIDLDLEGVDGARVMESVRPPAQVPIPVIALTRRGDLRTKLEAFDRGVDDVLSLPISPEELLARVVALLRRAYPETTTFSPVIRVGEMEINILHRTVRAGTSELHLTALEQSLLYLLASNSGRVVTREEILDALWGTDYVAESNVVDRQVRNLRARLQNDWRRPRFIATVPGRGYRFIPTY
jgi:two-component system KDP operon response regulator KdpE